MASSISTQLTGPRWYGKGRARGEGHRGSDRRVGTLRPAGPDRRTPGEDWHALRRAQRRVPARKARRAGDGLPPAPRKGPPALTDRSELPRQRVRDEAAGRD